MIYPALHKSKTFDPAKSKMPFRERLKKTFSRNSTSGDGSSTVSKSSSRQNSNIYQPGEKIPYKYRRPVAKDHKDKLNAFSFAGAWRRQSNQSQYSPMGSRLPSRRGSIASAIRKSIGNRPWNSNAGPVSERLNGGVSEGSSKTPTSIYTLRKC